MEKVVPQHSARTNAQNEILTALAANLRSRMDQNGLTYRTLASRAGVSSGTVSSLLSGNTDPRLHTLLRVAAALGFPSLESVFGDVELPSEVILADLRRGLVADGPVRCLPPE